jgi:4'-phosphopantetheinyl transferase
MPTTNPSSSWLPAPRQAQLAEGEVHVWRADLADAGNGVGELLSEDELARAERLRSPRDRERWTAARGILRALLNRHLPAGGSLEFATGPHGKPELPAAAAVALRFNISHSGSIALYAFALGVEVGVDVESIGRRRDELVLAERALGHAEAERLRALDPARREREFLRSWVRHEAGLKCAGVGLGGSSADVRGLWLSDVDLGPGALAAVAAAAPPRRLALWEWAGLGV